MMPAEEFSPFITALCLRTPLDDALWRYRGGGGIHILGCTVVCEGMGSSCVVPFVIFMFESACKSA